MKTPAAAILAMALSLSAFACTTMAPPPGFARLDPNDDYAWRATSAEGVVIAVRKNKNRPAGNLEFWTSAVRYELERKGYDRDAVDQVRSADGIDGRRLRYHTVRQGRPFILWATVYVTDNQVTVVEAGGDAAHFERVKPSIDQASRSVEAG